MYYISFDHTCIADAWTPSIRNPVGTSDTLIVTSFLFVSNIIPLFKEFKKVFSECLNNGIWRLFRFAITSVFVQGFRVIPLTWGCPIANNISVSPWCCRVYWEFIHVFLMNVIWNIWEPPNNHPCLWVHHLCLGLASASLMNPGRIWSFPMRGWG